jgi:chromosome segregation ATPase
VEQQERNVTAFDDERQMLEGKLRTAEERVEQLTGEKDRNAAAFDDERQMLEGKLRTAGKQVEQQERNVTAFADERQMLEGKLAANTETLSSLQQELVDADTRWAEACSDGNRAMDQHDDAVGKALEMLTAAEDQIEMLRELIGLQRAAFEEDRRQLEEKLMDHEDAKMEEVSKEMDGTEAQLDELVAEKDCLIESLEENSVVSGKSNTDRCASTRIRKGCHAQHERRGKLYKAPRE